MIKSDENKADACKPNERRRFLLDALKMAGAGACAISAISLLQNCEFDLEMPTKRYGFDVEFDARSEPLLAKVNGAVMQSFPGVNLGIPVLIIRIADDEYVCFSTLCTHDSCFGADLWVQTTREGIINCACHGSKFDPRNGGKPFEGPAERPLKQYQTEFNSETGILTIHF